MKKISYLFLFLFLSSGLYALDPKESYDATPAQYGMDYKDVTFQTEDDTELHGWYFKPTDQRSVKAMIISHDGKGNMEDVLEIASNFLTLGYHVLTYDYRGYGKSDDFNINEDFYIYAQFEEDLRAAIKFARKEISSIREIDLYGRGIGAGLSIAVGSGRNTYVRNIIADSPYYTMEDIRERFKEEKDKDIKVPLGYDKKQFEPAHAMKSVHAERKNYMFIAGKDDPIYTKDIVKDLEDLTDKGYLYLVRNATAQTTFTKNREKYFAELKSFLKN